MSVVDNLDVVETYYFRQLGDVLVAVVVVERIAPQSHPSLCPQDT